ncbi:Hypothetical protein FKW44_010247, partial [Caligus rogercresseyi]
RHLPFALLLYASSCRDNTVGVLGVLDGRLKDASFERTCRNRCRGKRQCGMWMCCYK